MPNGKVGDHWWTDITIHGVDVFSPEVDALIKEIDALVRDPRYATDPPSDHFEHPLRRRTEEIVDRHIDRIGFDELSGRGEFIGIWEKMTPKEASALEGDLRALRASLPAE